MKELIRHIIREHTKEIREMRKITTPEFIQKAQVIHGDKYDYSKTIYQTSGQKVEILCPEHGVFTPFANDHLRGVGCPKCAGLSKGSTEDFIMMAKKMHKDESGSPEYTYGNTNYLNKRTKVLVTCPKHGDFPVLPQNHLKGVGGGCPKCKSEKSSEREKYSQDQFIKLAEKTHGKKYDYSLVDYVDSKTKVNVICKKHGVFPQSPTFHLQGGGCPHCQESKGEKFIANFLTSINISFERQKKFEDCTNKISGKGCTKLPFDFFISSKNTCIEFDGIQHFEPTDFHGGEESFQYRKKLDKLKNQYCKKNGIKLIRIPYTMKKEDIEPYILSELGM